MMPAVCLCLFQFVKNLSAEILLYRFHSLSRISLIWHSQDQTGERYHIVQIIRHYLYWPKFLEVVFVKARKECAFFSYL